MRSLTIWLTLSVACLCSTANAQKAANQDLFGNWRIVAFRFGEGISVGPGEAKKLLRKNVQLSSMRAVFGNDICSSPVYESKRMTAEQFSQEFKTSLKSIGIRDDHVDLVNIQCSGSDWLVPGAILLKVRNGQMLTLWDGVFFVLKKQEGRT